MDELGHIAQKIRSKNAGPFWLTVDIFCGSAAAYERVVAGLSTAKVAQVFAVDAPVLRRFDIPALNVVKFSLPRPVVQGVVADRDMHGAGWASLLAELMLD